MKAILHDTAGPATVDHPDPPTGPGEAILGVSRVLLEPSDHASAARRTGFLGVPGSRLVGVVHGGDSVAVDPEIACGRCVHCRGGLSAACPERITIGRRGRDGGLAERVAVPEANLLRLPRDLDVDLATLAGPLGAGIALARRLRLPEDAHISVIGDGVAALAAAAALASRHPATRLLSDDAFATAVAAKWSLKHRGVAEAGRRHDQEAVAIFEASGGAGDSLAIAAGMIRPRGRIAWCCEGVAPDREGLDAMRRIEGELLGHAAASIREGLDLLAAGRFDFAPLLRRRIALEEASVALATGRPADLDGTLVVIDDDLGDARVGTATA